MDPKRTYLPAVIAGIIVILIYVWFISMGPWRARGYTSDYYSQMASAFRHGQIALERKPDPALLALPNLYDPKARKDIPLLGDASVYKGNYYLYFGPFPSIVLALGSIIVPIHAGDQIFTYVFILGLFLVQSLFLIAIVRRYYASLPAWLVALGILLLGLVGPFTRMLSHPFIHEAAISGGQLLSTAGLYLVFLALHQKPIDPIKLGWAGILWACALATRISQIVPIGAMVVVTLLYLLIENRNRQAHWSFLRPALTLTTPLLITGALLAWYNWARFDSVFEFGLYYQLAAFDLQKNYDALFSRVYIVQNIYNYFFNPFAFKDVFPFAFALPGSETSILAAHELPKLYAVEGKFAGLLTSAPFLVFAAMPVINLAGICLQRIKRNRNLPSSVLWDWIILCLLASFVAGALPTLLLFYVGFRYETEFVTGLVMLALIGFCQVHAWLKTISAQRALAVAGASIMIFSILVNLAVAFTGMRG